jgi:hypothetical protein
VLASVSVQDEHRVLDSELVLASVSVQGEHRVWAAA